LSLGFDGYFSKSETRQEFIQKIILLFRWPNLRRPSSDLTASFLPNTNNQIHIVVRVWNNSLS
jgi:hypothetical protein